MAKSQFIPHYEFLREFDNKKANPIYYIVGAETYLKDKVYYALKSQFSQPSSEGFDFNLFYGDSDEAVKAVEYLEMSPFLAEKRLVIIKYFDKMNAADKKLIADYCQNPSKTSILVLTADKSDGRSSACKIIESKAVNIACRPPYSASDIVRWLRSELQQKNITMDAQSIIFFASSIEPDYLIASNELEKLILFSKNSGHISKQAVEEVLGRSKANKVFDLQNSIGRKDLKNAVKILDNMIMNNEPAVYIITMLSRFFIQIWKILSLRKKNISDTEINSRYLNDVFFKYRKEYLSYANNFSLKQVKEKLSLLLQADIDVKSLNIKEDIILYTLIFKICSR